MVYEFDGTKYEKLRDMQAARRAKYLGLVRGGMNFTQAAHAVGVSKRTGKVWRNGRTRSTVYFVKLTCTVSHFFWTVSSSVLDGLGCRVSYWCCLAVSPVSGCSYGIRRGT